MPELLHEAITLIRADRLDDARQILFGIIRNDLQNEVAWIWLAETFSSDLDRLRVLKCMQAKCAKQQNCQYGNFQAQKEN